MTTTTDLSTNTNIVTNLSSEYDTVNVSAPVSGTYYKMRGYYVLGATYETYIVLDAPSNTPPSGHTLENIIIAATWQN